MSLTSSLCVFLFLGAFGSVVCGKAVGLEESEADNPCVHKGKKVTIDVRKIANMFKYVQSLRNWWCQDHKPMPHLAPGIFPQV